MSDSDGVADAQVRHEQKAVRDAYGFAFAFVLGSVLLLIAAGAPVDSWLAAGAGVLQVAALVLTLRVSGVGRRATLAGSIAAVALLSSAIIAGAIGAELGRAVAVGAWLLLTVSTIAAVLRRMRTYRYVTLQSVLGLLVIYVLLGITFGLAYLLVEVTGSAAFAQGPQGVSGAMYMSFITLATVGYGDVSPGSDVVRALAVAEAIVGQLYLVSVVSLAVSRLGTRRGEPLELRE